MKTQNKGVVCIFFIFLLSVLFFTSFSFALTSQQISSTFIQLSRSHHGWSHQQWEALFNEFESTHVNELIIQYEVILQNSSSKSWADVKNMPNTNSS